MDGGACGHAPAPNTLSFGGPSGLLRCPRSRTHQGPLASRQHLRIVLRRKQVTIAVGGHSERAVTHADLDGLERQAEPAVLGAK